MPALLACVTRPELYRSSVKKINLQEPLGFTAAFHGPHGPGLLAIARTADTGVSVLLLPVPLPLPAAKRLQPSTLLLMLHSVLMLLLPRVSVSAVAAAFAAATPACIRC